jgi:CRISPR-associated protein Cas2
MSGSRVWYLVCYDIRDPLRLRRIHKLLKGYGVGLQLSVFRCRLNPRQLERLRWELEKLLAPEDGLLIVGMCATCIGRVVVRNPRVDWDLKEESKFQIVS